MGLDAEYVDENFQIPSGSSIIIKRIPAGSVPSAAKWDFSPFKLIS